MSAFAALMALGVWQLQRLAWKEGLIAAATERPEAPAVAAPGPDAWPIAFDEWDYRRVSLTGRFGEEEAHAWITLSDPQGSEGGMGYFVLSPFTTADGWHVIVNRGFVPDAQKTPASRPASAPPEGIVTIEGLVRRDDPPSFATPAPDRDRNVWFARDVAEIARYLGLPPSQTAPYNVDLVADETPAGGLPQAGESRVIFTNNHLGYALTWFGLAAALVAVTAVALFQSRRRA